MKDGNNKDAYDSSGAVFHIQIKGTEDAINPVKEETSNYSIDKKSLIYVEKFSVPFFLFRVDVSASSGEIYFIWIQRYIKDVLDVESPFWRENPPKSITVRIPMKNEVSSSIERIQKIAFQPKYVEELVEYREFFDDCNSRISAILAEQHELNDEVIADLRNKAYRVRRLNVLLTQNDCCITHSCVDDFILYLDQLATKQVGAEMRTCPHKENVHLLAASLEGMSLVESFVQENEGRSVY